MKKILLFILALTLLLTSVSFSVLAEGITIIGQSDSHYENYGGEIELAVGKTVKVDGEYAISFIASKCPSKSKLLGGYWWYYLESEEDGAPLSKIAYPVGTHAPILVGINLTNRSKENVKWDKRVTCTIVFDDQYTFETIVMQCNPEQTSANGKKGVTPSTVAVEIEPLVSADIECYGAIPFIVRDSDKPLIAYVTIDGTDTYMIDLRNTLTIVN